MKNWITKAIFTISLVLGAINANAQSCTMTMCDDTAKTVLIKGKPVVDVGWGGGLSDANAACAEAPMPSCAQNCPRGCCDNATQRRCAMVMYRGQAHIQSTQILNQSVFYVPPTTFPCTKAGAQTCPEAEQLKKKGCDAYRKEFSSRGEDWSTGITKGSQAYKEWDKGTNGDSKCKDGSGLFNMSNDALSCKGASIAPPQTTFSAKCLTKSSDGHQVSMKISAIKKCAECSAEGDGSPSHQTGN